MSQVRTICTACQAAVCTLDELAGRKDDDLLPGDQHPLLEPLNKLRDIITKLESEVGACAVDGNIDLPLLITAEIVSILGNYHPTATGSGINPVSDNSLYGHASQWRQSLIKKTESDLRRLKIVLDILDFSSSNHSPSAGTTKADIILSMARTKGLFIPLDEGSRDDNPSMDMPPTYDEATRGETLKRTLPSEASLSKVPYQDDNPSLDAPPSFSSLPKGGTGASKKIIRERNPPENRATSASTTLSPTEISSIPLDSSSTEKSMLNYLGFWQSLEARVAVITRDAMQVYDGTDGRLLWEISGNSPQLIQRHEIAYTFSDIFKASPDGSLICGIATQESRRHLLVLQADSGRLKTKRLLGENDGSLLCISHDNKRVAIVQWASEGESLNFIKLISINADEQGMGSFQQLPFPPLQPFRGIAKCFTPDDEHIILCEGPGKRPDCTDLSISLSLYRIKDGMITAKIQRPAPTSSWNIGLLPSDRFYSEFLFPNSDQWLVAVPDFGKAGTTCVLDIKTGETVATVSAGRSVLQRWQEGVLPTAVNVGMHFDKVTRTFMRVEGTATSFTLTRYASLGGEMQRWQKKEYKTVVLSAGPSDTCQLFPGGSKMLIERASKNRIDVLSLHS